MSIDEILGQVGWSGYKAGANPEKKYLMEQSQIILPKAKHQLYKEMMFNPDCQGCKHNSELLGVKDED